MHLRMKTDASERVTTRNWWNGQMFSLQFIQPKQRVQINS